MMAQQETLGPGIDSSLLLRVAKREHVKLSELPMLLVDARSRRLVRGILKLQSCLHRAYDLIDPSISNVPSSFTKVMLAQANRSYFLKVRTQLIAELARVPTIIQEIGSTLLESSQIIEEVYGLTNVLGSFYKNVISTLELINTELASIESSAFTDDLLEHSSTLRKLWRDLEMQLKHQIIAPLKLSITERARENSLKRIGELVYGRATETFP